MAGSCRRDRYGSVYFYFFAEYMHSHSPAGGDSAGIFLEKSGIKRGKRRMLVTLAQNAMERLIGVCKKFYAKKC